MPFENRRQDLLPFQSFLIRLARFSLFAVLLIVFSVGLGTVGYHYYAELSWLDSFYMASMILTGMGPIADMNTNAAKLFSAFHALYSGIAFISISAVLFAPIIHRFLHKLHLDEEG
jgi:hypothetical protein